ASPNTSQDDPANVIERGELLESRHRSLTSFPFHFLFSLIVTPLALFLVIAVSQPYPPPPKGASVTALILIVLAVSFWIALFWRRACTVYDVYERRIDIREGVLDRTQRSVWTYEIDNPSLHRTLLNVLFGDAQIRLTADGPWIKGFGK